MRAIVALLLAIVSMAVPAESPQQFELTYRFTFNGQYVGNVTDRVRFGHVVDFLDFYISQYHWPAFNIADSCICVAACLFLISGFTGEKTANPSQP